MTIEIIPQSFRYTCDMCGKQHLQENAKGHYTNSCPPGWAWLKFDQDGAPPEKWLLCESCAGRTANAIENVMETAK